MKNTLYFLTIIITFSLLSCNSQKNINKSKDNQSKKQLLEIELSNDGILDFQLKNVSSDPIVLYQPLRLQLEKLEDDKWVKLRILPCPCDAPCQAPEEKIEILPGKSFSVSTFRLRRFLLLRVPAILISLVFIVFY